MTPLSTSKAYHHGDLRAGLLAATLELVEEHGIEGLSLREVSRRTGVSHAAAYNHFADKAALVSAFVDAAFDEFAAALRGARDAGNQPFDALVRIGVAYVLFAHEHRAQFKLMFRPELSGLGALDDRPRAVEAYDVLVDGVATALSAGVIVGDPETLVRTAWAVVHGLSALIVDGPSTTLPEQSADIERIATQTLRLLYVGMGPRR